jgi:uncharacterized Tic20 family protein
MPKAEENPTPKDEEKKEPAPEEETQATPEGEPQTSPEAEPESAPEPEEQESPPLAEDTESGLELEEETVVPEPLLPPPTEKPIPTSTEQNWAMLAHLSILLNLITGILGPVVALIIYLVYKDRSRYIAYQSLQSTIFQLIVWVGVGLVIGAIWLFTAILSIFLIGLLLIPFSLLATIFLLAVPLASLIYGVYAAIKCSHGEDFRYWLVGDWVRGTYEDA